MHLKEITLSHYRGAKKLTLPLNQHLNVLVGMNGAGKSSVLDACAIMLSWLVNRIKSNNGSGRAISVKDIRNHEEVAELDITLCAEGKVYPWRLVKARGGHSLFTASIAPSSMKQMSVYAKSLQQHITLSAEQTNVPLLAYYPVNRAVLDIPLRIRSKHQFTLMAAYDESLTSGANFRTFFEWFREREDIENENWRENKDYRDHQLRAVRKALETLMPEFSNLRIRRQPLRMEVTKAGEQLTVDQLSDGEKCLMAMVGDLARRMAIANPVTDNPLQGEGVVLIDEIDLHLHPKWQRMIVPRLREVFPNIQFIVSTHSPHVLTHVQAHEIFLMKQTCEGLSYEQPTESYGKSVERILEDLMGLDTTRPDNVTGELSALYRLVSDGQLDAAKSKIIDLKSIIGDDPALTKANVLIRRQEIINK